MKKILLAIICTMMALGASAQADFEIKDRFYIGGSVGWWRNFDTDRNGFAILPEVGYKMNEKWTGGITIGYINSSSVEVKEDPTIADLDSRTKAFIIEPYARYNVLKAGPVAFFVEGVVGVASSKTDTDDESHGSFRVGLKPGAAVQFGKKFSAVTHIGFVGYGDSRPRLFKNGYGFDFRGNNISFGLYYHL